MLRQKIISGVDTPRSLAPFRRAAIVAKQVAERIRRPTPSRRRSGGRADDVTAIAWRRRPRDASGLSRVAKLD
jgi:hypothetical protein